MPSRSPIPLPPAAPHHDAADRAAARHRAGRPPRLSALARARGFELVGVTRPRLDGVEAGLRAWLDAGFHGSMEYLQRHVELRAHPDRIGADVGCIVMVSMDYRPVAADWLDAATGTLADPGRAYVSRYALGRDYHRSVRQRLALLASDLEAALTVGDGGGDGGDGGGGGGGGGGTRPALRARAFTDSGPVMEVELARRAGLGWRGKHTLLLNRRRGSLFFLGALFLNVPPDVFAADDAEARAWPPADAVGGDAGGSGRRAARDATGIVADDPGIGDGDGIGDDPGIGSDDGHAGHDATGAGTGTAERFAADGLHCGSCRRCLDACPTQAIVAPYRVDARRCISYLTIETDEPIPLPLRSLIGNRIYGCDDCQLVCPWNRFAQPAGLPELRARNGLDRASLLELFAWTADEFDARLQGSAIRHIGHRRWQRNLAVGLGNARRHADAPMRARIDAALQDWLARYRATEPMVAEHVHWALAQQPGPAGRGDVPVQLTGMTRREDTPASPDTTARHTEFR